MVDHNNTPPSSPDQVPTQTNRSGRNLRSPDSPSGPVLFAASLFAPGALMQVPARRDAVLGCAAIVAKAGHKPSSDKKRFGQSKGQSAPPPPYLQPNATRAWVRGLRGLRMRTQRRCQTLHDSILITPTLR